MSAAANEKNSDGKEEEEEEGEANIWARGEIQKVIYRSIDFRLSSRPATHLNSLQKKSRKTFGTRAVRFPNPLPSPPLRRLFSLGGGGLRSFSTGTKRKEEEEKGNYNGSSCCSFDADATKAGGKGTMEIVRYVKLMHVHAVIQPLGASPRVCIYCRFLITVFSPSDCH